MNITLKVVFFLFSAGVFAQSEYPHVLLFKDGTEVQGKVVVWDMNALIFRKASTDEKQSYRYKSLKSIINSETRKEYDKGLYVLRQLKGTNQTLRLTKAISGKMDCFYVIKEGSSSGISDVTTVNFLYYFCKKGENEVIPVKWRPKFKKTKKVLIEYFEDCPDLISKIKEGYFEQIIEAFERMVIYYNTKC